MSTLPNASYMARDSAVAESSASGARDEEGDDDFRRRSRRDQEQRCGVEQADTRVEAILSMSYPAGIAMCAGRSWSLVLSGQIWAHSTRAHRTHVGAAFRPVAELDAGAIAVKNPLGCRLLRS
jgi:hypothetical protein